MAFALDIKGAAGCLSRRWVRGQTPRADECLDLVEEGQNGGEVAVMVRVSEVRWRINASDHLGRRSFAVVVCNVSNDIFHLLRGTVDWIYTER